MKSEFTTCLDCHLSDNESVWILNQPLVYNSERLNATVSVPKGFETDLASVPRVPVIYSLFGARAHHEAVIHDYLYRIDSEPVASRKDADKAFLEAMAVRGKPRHIRWPMYLGVRFGGFAAYHKKKIRIL